MKKRLEQPPTRFKSLLEGHIGQYRWLEALLSKTETDISLAELESLSRKLSDLLVEKQLASALQLAEHLQVRLAREEQTLSDPEWDLARAVLSVNRGVANYILGNLELANSSFRTASTLYSDPRRLGRSSTYDQDRAILARNYGECLERMGDTANALEKYDEAAHFFFQEHSRIQDPPNRNTLLMLLEGRGRCSEKMGQFQKAASSYSDALSIYESHFSSKNTEYRAARIRLAIGKARCLSKLGFIRDANDSLKYARRQDKRRGELQFEIAQIDYLEARISRQEFVGIGGLRHLMLRPDSVLEKICSIEDRLAQVSMSVDSFDLARLRALVASECGCWHVIVGLRALRREMEGHAILNLRLARLAFERAEQIYEHSPVLGSQLAIEFERSLNLVARAEMDARFGLNETALSNLDIAIELYFKNLGNKEREAYRIEVADALIEKALCLSSLGDVAAALTTVESAIEVVSEGLLSPRDIQALSRAYKVKARLFSQFDIEQDLEWLKDGILRIAQFLDVPLVEVQNSHAVAARRSLQELSSWGLKLCLDRASLFADALPEILLSFHGWQMVLQIADEMLADLDGGKIDPLVRQFATHRIRLRAAERELRNLEDPSGAIRRGDYRAVMLRALDEVYDGPKDDAVSRMSASSTDMHSRRAKVAAARKRYEALKAAAAEVPGYEILADPVKQITVERLQSGLGAEELLVLVLPHEDPDAEAAEKVTTSHLWVLGKTGAPRLVHAPTPSEDVPGVADLAALFRRAGASLSVARGGVRKSPDRPGADKPEPLPEAMLGTAWSEIERGMRQLIWTPLEASGALEGVSQVTVCTMGAFHNLPVASGAPEGLTVRSAGALPIFALSRGLYAGPGNEASDEASAPTRPAAAVEAPVALLYDDDVKASSDIPQTGVEIAASQWLWERARDGAVIRASGVPFAEAEGPVVRLAHAACHGTVDGSVTPPLPILKLGSGVTERDLVRRPVVEGWMFMACVVGQNFDDLIEGTPVGLVNGALRNGAQTVVAFLSPVPDTIGLLTGLTITAQVSHRGIPLGAAADHARRVLDPTHPEDDPELMRLVAEALAAHRAEDFARELAAGGTPAGLEKDVPPVLRIWTDFIGLAETLAGAESPPSAAELAPILARHIHPRIPAETPEDRLRLGVLQHALVVFEGYPQG